MAASTSNHGCTSKPIIPHDGHKSSRSSSSSHPPFLLLTTIFPPVVPSRSLFSATAPRSSLSWSSVTLARSCPDLANMIKRFSTSVARDSLTIRMRPRRSAASGWRIWERIEARASAARSQCYNGGEEVTVVRQCTPSCCLYQHIKRALARSVQQHSLTSAVHPDRQLQVLRQRRPVGVAVVAVAPTGLFLSGSEVSSSAGRYLYSRRTSSRSASDIMVDAPSGWNNHFSKQPHWRNLLR